MDAKVSRFNLLLTPCTPISRLPISLRPDPRGQDMGDLPLYPINTTTTVRVSRSLQRILDLEAINGLIAIHTQ